MSSKLTATLSDGRTIEVEERDGVLIPMKKEPELRPAPKQAYIYVGTEGGLGSVWGDYKNFQESPLVKSGPLVRYVRDDERYDKHEEWWTWIYNKQMLCSSKLYSTQEAAREWPPLGGFGLKLARVRIVEEVPHE